MFPWRNIGGAEIAVNRLDWPKIAPLVKQWLTHIAADVQSDARKISSTAAFTKA